MKTIVEKIIGPTTIGTMVASYRRCNDVSVEGLAKKLKVSKSYVTSIESGKKQLSLSDAIKLADKLGEVKELYAHVWFEEQAREAGIDVDVQVKIRH